MCHTEGGPLFVLLMISVHQTQITYRALKGLVLGSQNSSILKQNVFFELFPKSNIFISLKPQQLASDFQ